MVGSVIFSVVFESEHWSLKRDGVTHATFETASSAERRGRWLAAHAAVRDLESQVDIYDRLGNWLGAWRNEVFEPALIAEPSLAA